MNKTKPSIFYLVVNQSFILTYARIGNIFSLFIDDKTQISTSKTNTMF